MIGLFVCLTSFLLVNVIAFRSSQPISRFFSKTDRSTRIYGENGSYEKMLEAAKLKRSQPQEPESTVPSMVPTPSRSSTIPSSPAPKLGAVQSVSSVPSPASNPNNNGLPFNDNMYEKLKFVIGKLTAKIRSDASLTEKELLDFEAAIETIIADSKADRRSAGSDPFESENFGLINNSNIENETKVTSSETAPASEGIDAEFDAFRGLKSTWQVPNSEKMSSEEYYAAINRRNAEIRAIRRASGRGLEESKQYLENLSKKR